MKKTDVLQLAIVLLGLVLGFTALQYFLSTLYDVFAWIFSGGYGAENYMSSNLTYFAILGLQVIVCWLLVTKSGAIAKYIRKSAELGTGFQVVSKPATLLQILLIVLGIYLLFAHSTTFLTAVIDSFISRSPRGVRGLFEDERPIEWIRLLLNILLPLLLLMFAKPIANYFIKNVDDETISVEEKSTETENKTD